MRILQLHHSPKRTGKRDKFQSTEPVCVDAITAPIIIEQSILSIVLANGEQQIIIINN